MVCQGWDWCMAVCLWQWIAQHPWRSITGVILIVAAVGGAVKWWYDIKKLRREEREIKHDADLARCYSAIRAKCETQAQQVRGFAIPIEPSCPETENESTWEAAWQRYRSEREEEFKKLYNVSKMPTPPSSSSVV
jgi:hypothetical protein